MDNVEKINLKHNCSKEYFIAVKDKNGKVFKELLEIKNEIFDFLSIDIDGKYFFDDEKMGFRNQIVKRLHIKNEKNLDLSEILILEKFGDIITGIIFDTSNSNQTSFDRTNDNLKVDIVSSIFLIDLSKLKKGSTVKVLSPISGSIGREIVVER